MKGFSMAQISDPSVATVTGGRATAAIEAAVARGTALGVPFAVVVVDSGGSPVASQQMAGAAPSAIEAGAAKAATAVLFARATRALARTSLPGTQLSPDAGQADGRTAAFAPGGVPLTDSRGRAVGAVGVCGGTPEQDHEVAVAAAAAAAGG
jgi:uncharacterized protein GlcG (DUF336 family)